MAAHTVVIFGVKIVRGELFLIVIEPLDGLYEDLSVNKLRGNFDKLIELSALTNSNDRIFSQINP